ncbi:DUF4352 domain-containing protein [Sediminibacillus terrae]|uniref:DUF4352 domain-containing protein n=1 Tax=Sediminibacillus terrae TaxID=1562106 RepID=UPI001295E0CD|nr:DUF4352 domain-containing protein [Sediminibacillus terrae]
MAKKEKVKKPIYKKWWVWALAIIVVIAIATGGGEDDTTAGSDKAEDSGEQTASADSGAEDSTSEDKKEEPKEEIPGIGDTVEVGAMTYTINEKTTSDEVGPSVAPETANGTYLVLDITALNNGDESVTIDGSYFKLKQGDKTFEADSMASISANQGEDGTIQNSFFMEQLNPGSEMSGKVVFDIAPDIAESDDLVVEAQEGIFGTVTETIELQ